MSPNTNLIFSKRISARWSSVGRRTSSNRRSSVDRRRFSGDSKSRCDGSANRLEDMGV